MNKDQVTGVTKDIAGKVQESVGKMIGSKEQEAKGLGKQIEGKTEKTLGDAKEIMKDAVDKI
ncbi:MAG: CsbD family protein [Burkholderiaceae bacterium]